MSSSRSTHTIYVNKRNMFVCVFVCVFVRIYCFVLKTIYKTNEKSLFIEKNMLLNFKSRE
jgi:hypothetical protein